MVLSCEDVSLGYEGKPVVASLEKTVPEKVL